ncbi:MAG: magnesium transporter [Eubacteriales bacterium]
MADKENDTLSEEEHENAESQREEQIEDNFSECREFLERKQYSQFRKAIEEMNPVDAAEFFSSLEYEMIPAVFKLVHKDSLAEIFAELESDVQEKIITAMTDREIRHILDELFVDDAVDLIEELPANVVARVMKVATPETRDEINKFLAYPENSAGSVMTSEFISLHKSMTVSEAIEHIRKTGVDKETVYSAYVTDEKRVLEGTVSFKELLFSSENKTIDLICNKELIYAYTTDDQEYVADTIAKYGLLALPIVDNEMRLVGIVTVDDAIDVIQEEATEDIEIMAAITPSDKSYMKTGVLETCRKRFPWLLVLMLSAIFSSAIITHYESAIGTYAILTAFFPMLMNTGGNAGSQSSVAIIRAMSLDEIGKRDFFRVVWKEFRVSLLCALGLGAVCFLKTMAIDFRFVLEETLPNGAIQNNLMISFVVSITACCAVIFAKFIGTILPMGAKKIGLDPAVMASPFITTIVDTVTLVIYFAIASQVLGF